MAYTIKITLKTLLQLQFCSHQLPQCVNNSLIKMKACSVRLKLAPYVFVSTHLALVNSKRTIAENYFLKTPFLCLQWLLGGKRNCLSKGNGINSFTQTFVFSSWGDGGGVSRWKERVGGVGCKKAVEKVTALVLVCGNSAADGRILIVASWLSLQGRLLADSLLVSDYIYIYCVCAYV